MPSLTLDRLRSMTRDAAALRARVRLQPAGGPGDKVFPPTYATDGRAQTKYATEPRRIDGEVRDCVLLDSVASQANRMELALRDAIDEGDLAMPLVRVDFTQAEGLEDLGHITTLDAPHRVADAILRDSTLDGKLFRTTELGRSFTDARPDHATPMYRVCPHALLLGIWDSTGPKGGNGAKFQRVLVSEIVAIDAETGVKSASRIDPLAVARAVPIYKAADSNDGWVADPSKAEQKKGKPVPYGSDGRPSEANHGNVAPSLDTLAGGVTFDHAVQTVVLSLTGLRQLRFQTAIDGSPLTGSDRKAAQGAARTVLAALGLVAITQGWRAGFHLRSRYALVPESAPALEVVHADGKTEDLALTADEALTLFEAAVQDAAKAGLGWDTTPVDLLPSTKLVTLISESRKRIAGLAPEDA